MKKTILLVLFFLLFFISGCSWWTKTVNQNINSQNENTNNQNINSVVSTNKNINQSTNQNTNQSGNQMILVEESEYKLWYPSNLRKINPVPYVLNINSVSGKEYLQIQVLDQPYDDSSNYRPNNADYVGQVTIDSKTADKYYTDNPIGEAVLTGYPFTVYTIKLAEKKWIQIEYYGSGDIATTFEEIISSMKIAEFTIWKDHSSVTYNYSIRYPEDLAIDSSNSDKDFTARGSEKEMIGGDTSWTDEKYKSSVITLMVYKIDRETTIDKFISDKGYISMTEVEYFSLPGLETKQYSFIGVEPKVEGVKTFIKKNDKMFLIELSGLDLKDAYYYMLPTFTFIN